MFKDLQKSCSWPPTLFGFEHEKDIFIHQIYLI